VGCGCGVFVMSANAAIAENTPAAGAGRGPIAQGKRLVMENAYLKEEDFRAEQQLPADHRRSEPIKHCYPPDRVLVAPDRMPGTDLPANQDRQGADWPGHYIKSSPRSQRPDLIRVNCAAIRTGPVRNANVVRSPLRGAFTGANGRSARAFCNWLMAAPSFSMRSVSWATDLQVQVAARAADSAFVSRGRRAIPVPRSVERAHHCCHQQAPCAVMWKSACFREDLYLFPPEKVFPHRSAPLRQPRRRYFRCWPRILIEASPARNSQATHGSVAGGSEKNCRAMPGGETSASWKIVEQRGHCVRRARKVAIIEICRFGAL